MPVPPHRTQLTDPLWPLRTCSVRPVLTTHIRQVPSLLALTRRALPSLHTGLVLVEKTTYLRATGLTMIRLPRHAQHPLGVAIELLVDRLAGLRVPYPDCLIHGTGRQLFAIRTPIDPQHPASMPFQCVLRRAGVRIPDTSRVVAASGCQTARRYGGELGGQDRLAVAGDTMSQTRDGVDFEDCLRLGAECNGGPNKRIGISRKTRARRGGAGGRTRRDWSRHASEAAPTGRWDTGL